MSTPPRTARIVVDDRAARIVAGPQVARVVREDQTAVILAGPHVARVVRFDRTVVIVVPFPIVAPPPVGDSGQLDFSNVNNSAWIGAV
jgi:hypothetical protein